MGEWTQKSWRQIPIETLVTSYWAELSSSSLTGMWWWRLGRFPSTVIEAGMLAPQALLPNCTLEDFAGDLQHFEGDIYKKQQLPLRDKLGRTERCCSPQRHIIPAAHLPPSFCQHAYLGKIWSGTPALQVAEPLMKLLPAVMRKASELFPFIQVATIPQPQLQITSASSDLLCCASKMENSVAKSASRPPAAFSSCRHLCRHLLGFQLWLSLDS